MNFEKFSRTSFFTEHLRWLFLKITDAFEITLCRSLKQMYFAQSRTIVMLIVMLKSFFSQFEITQLTFTCFKTTIETLEKGVKYVKS